MTTRVNVGEIIFLLANFAGFVKHEKIVFFLFTFVCKLLLLEFIFEFIICYIGEK